MTMNARHAAKSLVGQKALHGAISHFFGLSALMTSQDTLTPSLSPFAIVPLMLMPGIGVVVPSLNAYAVLA